MGKGGGGDTTQSVTNVPWEGAIPLEQGVMDAGKTLFDMYTQRFDQDPNSFTYTGQRVAPMNSMQELPMNNLWSQMQYGFGPYTMNAQGPITQLAGGGPGTQQEAINTAFSNAYDTVGQDALSGQTSKDLTNLYKAGVDQPSGMMDTVSGRMLNPETNQYLRGAYEAATRPMVDTYKQNTAQTGSSANQAGRYGSSAWAELQGLNDKNLEQGLGDLASNMYGNAYNQERANQLQAMRDVNAAYGTQSARELGFSGLLNQANTAANQQQLQALSMLPQFDQSWLKNIGAAIGVGDTYQQQQQAQNQGDMQAFYAALQDPFNMLSAFGNLATTGGQMGGTTNYPIYQPGFGQQLMGGVGNAAGMGQIFNQFGLPSWAGQGLGFMGSFF